MAGDPYRAGKPLGEIIAPDRRRQNAVLLAITSMVVGAVLWQILRAVLEPGPPMPVPIEPSPSPPPPVTAPTRVEKLGPEDIRNVVAAHSAGVKQACWQSRPDAPPTAKVTVTATIDANGRVGTISSNGTDPFTASCVEAQVRTWQFPAHGEHDRSIVLPFLFAKE